MRNGEQATVLAGLPVRVSLAIGLALVAVVCFGAQDIAGKVIGVTDGDTVTLLVEDNQQMRIRIAGIDAPEKGQPFGMAAKKRLSEIVYAEMAVARCYKTDRYGRHVCELWADQQDVGLRMVRDGYAWHYKRFQDEQTPEAARQYSDAEDAARSATAGLWKGRVIRPWEWRAGVR